MTIIKRLLVSVISLALLSGCWDSKEIEKMAYVTALGFDYVDGKYKAYAQILNFANIAKNESLEIGKVVPVWIGLGEGRTVSEAASSLYSTAQERVFWGHVRTIVCSENLLKQEGKIQQVYSTVNRYREIRYNVLIYGTKESIAKIFALKSLLNAAPIESILSTPQKVYEQFSIIKPEYGYKVIADSSEGSGSVIIPSLAIDTGTWLEDEKKKSLLKTNGAFMLRHNKLLGWMSEEDLRGVRWLQRDIDRVPTNVPNTEDPIANVVIIKPRHAIVTKVVKGEVQYNVKVSANIYLNELIEPTPNATLKRDTAKVIASEIRNSYNKGLAIQSDVLNLENSLFRSNIKKWKELQPNNEFLLTEDSLHDIEVKVHIIHSGKYKSSK